jgi:hypothetical protein
MYFYVAVMFTRMTIFTQQVPTAVLNGFKHIGFSCYNMRIVTY